MTADAHPLPHHLLDEVDEIIVALRAGRPRRLDIDGIAASLHLDLTRRSLGGSLRGFTLDEKRIVLDSSLYGARLSFVFAHELAHVLRQRGHFGGLTDRQEEWFADWFARELVLPRRWLSDSWPDTSIGCLHVDAETVALQLAVLARCPALMRNGSRVLCRTCGTRMHDRSCACVGFRRRRTPSTLPDIHKLEVLYRPPWRQTRLSIGVASLAGRDCTPPAAAAA
jgi:IrrE N-terminal-like domain